MFLDNCDYVCDVFDMLVVWPEVICLCYSGILNRPCASCGLTNSSVHTSQMFSE